MDETMTGWTRISPSDLKNPVDLFGKDWMALAVGKEGDMNALTISWGETGKLWELPVCTVFVSTDRYTHSFMERFDHFTVTAFPPDKKRALAYIGSHSGRDGDKLKAAGLTPLFTELGNPVFREGCLAIECRILYKTPFEPHKMSAEVVSFYNRRGMGIHTMYIGQILNIWTRTPAC